jgi:hypothetical protein
MKFEKECEQGPATMGGTDGEILFPDRQHVPRYMRDRSSPAELAPEKKLMLAVLEDAVRCFQTHHTARKGHQKREFEKAQRWLFDFCGDWVFSFESICSELELDPLYVRSGLARWLKNAAPSRPASFWTRRQAS